MKTTIILGDVTLFNRVHGTADRTFKMAGKVDRIRNGTDNSITRRAVGIIFDLELKAFFIFDSTVSVGE